MEELIKTSLLFYLFCTAFMGLWSILVVYGMFKKTKSIENKPLKNILRIGVACILFGLWTWHFVFMNLYPISLAYYEFKHDFTEEKIGVVENVEQRIKDRVYITVDGEKYTMLYNSTDSFAGNNHDTLEGNTVKIKIGKKSKFIFNVSELNSNPISPISYSVGVYCFIGCELSVGLDLVAWNDELISIFYDSMSYDN